MRRFIAIVGNELLLNSKRVAPYVLMVLFAGNAWLWWAKGPAVELGWATNSDYYIHRNLIAFCFLTGMPIFNAVIVSDSIIKDFTAGIDGLLFSKPINRAQYVFGKFAGSFITLVCCQSAFILTLIVLQFFRTSRMVVQPFRVWPYFKHFFLLVVISHLVLAAFYFAVGTLTRSAKLVYGLAVAFYPIYISYQLFVLKGLPQQWTVLLDPILLRSNLQGNGFLNTAEFLNQLVMTYTSSMLLNRGLTILWALLCLTIVYVRFSPHEPERAKSHLLILQLSGVAEYIYAAEVPGPFTASQGSITIPTVARAHGGVLIALRKLWAATTIELNLLRAERSLVVLLPLAIVLCILEIAFFPVPIGPSYAANYASQTATAMLIFLIGFSVFYTGEAMHRDREINIEPVLWTAPVSNGVLILSKFLSTLVLLLALIASVGLVAVAIQLIRQHTPIDLFAYCKVYGLILFPSAFILTAISVLGNVVLRNKYVFYATGIGTAASLFFLFSSGYNHWLYNPALYRLWTYADFATRMRTIMLYRLCWLMIAITCLALAHLFFERRSRRKANLPLPFALR